MLYGVNQRLRIEDVDSPLVAIRPVNTVLLVVVTGDRGLCGGYNNFIIKKTEQRFAQLTAMGVKAKLVCVGKKGAAYFKRRPQYEIERERPRRAPLGAAMGGRGSSAASSARRGRGPARSCQQQTHGARSGGRSPAPPNPRAISRGSPHPALPSAAP